MISAGFYPQVGGIERQLLGLSRALAREGYPVEVLTRYPGNGPVDEELEGVRVHRVRLLHPGRTLASASFLLGGLRWIRKRDPSPTSSHGLPFDIFHCHQAFSATNLGVIAKRILGGGRVLAKITTAGVLSEMAAVTRDLPLASLRRRLLKEVDVFIAISDEISREIQAAGIPEERIARIPNGVALPELWSLRPESRRRARSTLCYGWKRIAVFVGRLAWEKGLFVLLDAWKEVSAKLPDAGLVLVGDGGGFRNVEEELRGRARALGLTSSVLFAGRQADVGPMLQAADVVVQPSFSEGMSNAILEAMASARAVVATDLPSNRELIRPGENGYLVPPARAGELAEALSAALRSSEKLEAMGKRSREIVERSFSFECVVERYRLLYESLISRGHPAAGLS